MEEEKPYKTPFPPPKPGERRGGKALNTPNKDKPLKKILAAHSLEYFSPLIEDIDDAGNKTGRLVSQFDLDLRNMSPSDRADLETKLLNYHTPKMQAATVDVSLSEDINLSVEERLAQLASENS